MFAFVAQATLLRPSLRANSNANRAIFSASLHADQLQALGHARRLHVLDAGVEVLDVLPDHHEVDAPTGVRGRDARQLADRADVRVGLEQLAERDVGALLAEPDGRLQRPLQRHARAGDRVHRLGRHARGKPLLEDLGAGLGLLPVDRGAGGLHDPPGGVDALRTDPVAGDQRDQGSLARRDHAPAPSVPRAPHATRGTLRDTGCVGPPAAPRPAIRRTTPGSPRSRSSPGRAATDGDAAVWRRSRRRVRSCAPPGSAA